MFHSTVTMGQS